MLTNLFHNCCSLRCVAHIHSTSGVRMSTALVSEIFPSSGVGAARDSACLMLLCSGIRGGTAQTPLSSTEKYSDIEGEKGGLWNGHVQCILKKNSYGAGY